MSDVTQLLDQIGAGQTTVDAVAADFAKRKWPVPPQPTGDAFEQDAQDPEPDPEGSFSEVAGYYAMGKLDDQQYAALAQAAAGAMK